MAFEAYWQEFLDALRAVTVAAWPEVATGGVWESTQSSQTAYSRARLPKAVLQMLPARPGEWGGHLTVWEQPVAIWYVSRDISGGSTGDWRVKLKVLQNAIMGNANTGIVDAPGASDWQFQCIGHENLDLFERNEANLTFFSRDTGYLAGNVAFLFLLGDMP